MDYIEGLLHNTQRWELALSDLKRKYYLHLNEKSLLKSVDLQKFDGSYEKDTVYSFLSIFFKLTACACTPIEQAALLYNSYLAVNIQREVEPLKNSIEAIKEYLISHYGDMREVAEKKLRKIAKIPHPDLKSATSQINYYKQVLQLIQHCESLIESEMANGEEIKSIIYNSSYVKSLVSHLPDKFITRFCTLLDDEPRIPPPSGKRYFDILKGLIDSIWRQLDTAQNIRSIREPLNSAEKPKILNPKGTNKQLNVQSNVTNTPAFSCPYHFTPNAKHNLG